jgi:ferrochelatase
MNNEENTKAILLVNLGSPEAPTKQAVKPYLDEFLMDGRVIDAPKWLRTLLVRGIILNFRPKKSAEAYASIWWDEGSPLIVLSKRLQAAVQKHSRLPVGLGMRYGKPSIKTALDNLHLDNPNLKEVLLVPLYPHYAMSSYETVVMKTREVVEDHFPHLKLAVKEAFYHDPNYLEVLSQSIADHLPANYDQLLFSYHGIPERHIRKSDITKGHCLKIEDCCQKDSPAHHFCYRHQTTQTTQLVAKRLNLPEGKYSTSFQSRLGSDPWLTPFTDKTIIEMAKKGVKKLVVVCPAFVSDCLETIEEIGEEAHEFFTENGGEDFTLIPCLNDREDWVKLLATWANNFAEEKELSGLMPTA